VTAAARFFWLSQATEDQAVDRVHRLGQTRPVTVVRFVVEVRVQQSPAER